MKDLTSSTRKVFRFIGFNPFGSSSVLSKIYFFAALFYVCICMLQEIVYFVTHVGGKNSFLSLTNLAPCLGFSTLSFIKILTCYGNRKMLKEVVVKLERFPSRQGEAQAMSERMTKALIILFMTLIWIFNLMPLFVSIYYFAADGSYHKQMPYFMWYPWDPLQPLVYEVCYALVMWGAFTSCVGILGSDLMLCSVINLICMRLNSLRDEIRTICSKKLPKINLRVWINNHNELLHIIDDVEGIFTLTLLFDFIGSSIIICLVGFQALVRFNKIRIFH